MWTHTITVNVTMSRDEREVLTMEEFHRRMGHIARETIKKMVSSKAVEDIDVDLTTTVQYCGSCEYAKVT